MDHFKEREQIKELVNTLFISIDNKDWKTTVEVFTEEVDFDLSSMNYGPAGKISCDLIAEIFKDNLTQYDHIHHQTGDFRINYSDDGAEVFCYVVVFFYKDSAPKNNKVKRFVGSYEFKVERVASIDKISSIKYNLKFVDGNTNI